MRWHYGPTADEPEPGKMWHYDCGGEVWIIDSGYICTKCNAQDDELCEHCGQPTSDWRDTGYFCSDVCHQAEIKSLIQSHA